MRRCKMVKYNFESNRIRTNSKKIFVIVLQKTHELTNCSCEKVNGYSFLLSDC